MSDLKNNEGEVFSELISTLAIPQGMIPLTEFDLLSMTTDMQNCLCIEVEGDVISQVEQQINMALSTIGSMPRNSGTFESMGYVYVVIQIYFGLSIIISIPS